MYSNGNYQNLPGKNCWIDKNSIMISPYSIFEVDKLPHDEIFKIIIFCCYHAQISLTTSQTQSDIFHTKMLQNALWCQITWSNACCLICWNIAPKHWIQGIATHFIFVYDFI
jgi:hypothetical protein